MRRGAGHRKARKGSVPVMQSERSKGRGGAGAESAVCVRRCPEQGGGRQGLRARRRRGPGRAVGQPGSGELTEV